MKVLKKIGILVSIIFIALSVFVSAGFADSNTPSKSDDSKSAEEIVRELGIGIYDPQG